MSSEEMMSHTPGPWKFTGARAKHDSSAIVFGPKEEWVAAAYDFNRYDRDEEVEANARLIAAAPDLLAMCETISTWCGSDDGAHCLPFEPPWYQDLHAAIAKATGS